MLNFDIILMLTILAVTMVLFVSEKLRPDVAALVVLTALLLLGLLQPQQALYGFANQATAIIAAMFIISAGLVRTGLVDWLARRVDTGAGRSRIRFILVLCLTTALLSTFIVNSAVVAIFIPISVILAEKRKIPISFVLIPMAFASQLGGACTLIGSSTHILMNALAVENGRPAFGMFEFTPLGAIIAAAGILYLVLLARKLLPRRKGAFQKIDKYRLADYLSELSLTGNSPLLGKRWSELEKKARRDIQLIRLIRVNKAVSKPAQTVMRERDVLLVHGDAARLMQVKDEFQLQTRAEVKIDDRSMTADDLRLIEAVIPPRSILEGRTLEGSDFRRRFGCLVLAIQRRGKVLHLRLDRIRLQAGDALLLQCPHDEIGRILRSQDLVMTEEMSELHLRKNRTLIALALLGAVVTLSALQVIPILTATLLGAVGMIVTGCLTAEEAYRSINWQVIFLLGGILPLGLAMQQTGTAQWLADTVMRPLMGLGPYVLLVALYLLTALLTEGMSNMAAAVLLAPIALSMAAALGVSPRPFLVVISFAASTSFATPIGFQTNTMIYAPGGYRFTDFTRVGLPLNLLFCLIVCLLVQVFWPL
ncbi:MAG: SLC13 family permease [Candidatus Aminicenantaceae bacterium]